jgi:hypothetical protein
MVFSAAFLLVSRCVGIVRVGKNTCESDLPGSYSSCMVYQDFLKILMLFVAALLGTWALHCGGRTNEMDREDEDMMHRLYLL